MTHYQLNAGDSVVVTVTATDDATGLIVTPDVGSVTAVLSSSTDSIVANLDGTYTITASSTTGTGSTLTVNARVGGVASTVAVGTYDVVAAVVGVGATTTLSVTFGLETAPAFIPNGVIPVFVTEVVAPANRPVAAGSVAGQINPVTGLINE